MKRRYASHILNTPNSPFKIIFLCAITQNLVFYIKEGALIQRVSERGAEM
jgi:hypothetical protein